MTTSSAPSVFVTGAAGFIGRTLVARLRADGSGVRGVDLVASDDDAIVRGDITKPGPWQEHAAGCDVVIHTAAVVGMYTPRAGWWEGNVVGTRLALDAAIAGGARRFVNLSSIVVFGFVFEGEVDERTPVRPNGVHYVYTKIAAEQVVLAAHAAGEIECTIVRPGDVYGPGSRPWTMEPVRLLKSGRFALPGGGAGRMSPVYVDDLVDGIVRAAESPAAAGRIYVVTGAQSASFADFVGHYCRMLGVDPPRSAPVALARHGARVIDTVARVRGQRNELTPWAIDYFMRPGTYSIARAREELDYEPAHDLDSGMALTEAWLRAEGHL